jgi:hypothetical protein
LPPVPVVLPPVPVVLVVDVVDVVLVVLDPVVPVELLPPLPQAIRAEEPRMAIGGRKRRVEERAARVRAAVERMGMSRGSWFKKGSSVSRYLATFITVSPALLAQ